MKFGIAHGFIAAAGLALAGLPATAEARQKLSPKEELGVAMTFIASENPTERDVGLDMLKRISRSFDKATRANIERVIKSAEAAPVDLDCKVTNGQVDAEGYYPTICTRRTQTGIAPAQHVQQQTAAVVPTIALP